MPLARDAIIAFMQDHRGPVCRNCLSTATGVSLSRVLDGWNDLVKLHADYDIRRAECTICGDRTDGLVKRR